jgi:hypothetical protein
MSDFQKKDSRFGADQGTRGGCLFKGGRDF